MDTTLLAAPELDACACTEDTLCVPCRSARHRIARLYGHAPMGTRSN